LSACSSVDFGLDAPAAWLECAQDAAQNAAKAAGDAILAVRAGEFAVQAKADASPVTEADLAAHAVLLWMLAPTGLPVLSEEGAARVLPAARFWLVDPLDGTREFARGSDEFCVCIALIERGVPVLGVLHAPVSGRMWSSLSPGLTAPDEAWHGGGAGSSARPLRVLASRSHRGARLDGWLHALQALAGEAGEGVEELSIGSAIKFGWLAEGRADLYLRDGPTCWWDIAAGQAVLEAAGGVVLQLDGTPLRYPATGRAEPPPDCLNPPFVAASAHGKAWLARLLPRLVAV